MIKKQNLMEVWVQTHSINGPSPHAFNNLSNNELLIFYNIDNDTWSVVDNPNMITLVKYVYGIYYVVFKDEFVEYLNRN